MITDDADLLRRFVETHSEEAFAELVRRHIALVYHAALRQVNGDTHHAEDLAQTVFSLLARKAPALVRHQSLAGWLHTATRFSASQLRRAEHRRRTREREAHVMHELTHHSDAADWDQLRPVIDQALGDLNERDREAVLLRFFADLPLGEIGRRLDLTENAARMRVDRAVDKLRALLVRRGVTSTSAALALALSSQAAAAAPAGLAASVAATALAGGGGATVLSAFYFMSSTKLTTACVAGAVFLALGVAWYETNAHRSAVAALASAQHEHAARLADLGSLDAQIRDATQQLAQAQRSIEAQRIATPPSAAAGNRDPVAAGKAFLEKFPDVRRALLGRSYARIRGQFLAMYASLHLSPEQIARFEELMLDGEGLTLNFPETGPLSLQPGAGRSRAEREAAIRTLLGDEGYQRYREATDASRGKLFTSQLASALCFTDTPLTSQQAAQLAPVVARAEGNPAKGADVLAWNQLFEEAQPILSATQLAALGRMRAQAEFGYTMKQLLLK